MKTTKRKVKNLKLTPTPGVPMAPDVVLFRKDLFEIHKDKKFDDLKLYDFQIMTAVVNKAKTIRFQDEDGSIKTFKGKEA